MPGSGSVHGCFEYSSSLVASSSSSCSSSKKKKRSAAAAALKSRSRSSATPSLASVGGRDPSLDLFHALGKVLYCKREEGGGGGHPSARPLSRSNLLFDPEEVLDRAPTSPESFACFLHQNYPPFFSKMEDLAEAAGRISDADQLFVEWTVGKTVFGKSVWICPTNIACVNFVMGCSALRVFFNHYSNIFPGVPNAI